MYVYLALYWIWSLVAFLARKTAVNRVLGLLFAVFLLFFIGGRFEVGCDTYAYEMRYLYMYEEMGWRDAILSQEGGFHVLNLVAHDMGWGFEGLLLICAVICIAGLVRFSWMFSHPLTIMVACFPVLMLQLGMSGLRQAVALAFLMFAYASFVDRKRLMVIVWVCIAAMFHVSAIIFLPMVMLVGRVASPKRLILALVLIGPVVLFLLQDRLEVYSDRYIEQIYGENSSSGAWLRYILVIAPFLLYTLKRRLVDDYYPQFVPLFRLFLYASVATALIGIASSIVLHRLNFYVMPVSILLLACLSHVVFDKKSKVAGWLLPFLFFGAYMTAWFVVSKHASACYVPYQNWLLS